MRIPFPKISLFQEDAVPSIQISGGEQMESSNEVSIKIYVCFIFIWNDPLSFQNLFNALNISLRSFSKADNVIVRRASVTKLIELDLSG